MGQGPTAEAPARRRRVLLPTIIVLAILVGAFVLFTGFYTDWLWFVSVDKTEVFTTSLLTRVLMFAVFGAVMAIVIALVMWIAWRTRPTFRGRQRVDAHIVNAALVAAPDARDQGGERGQPAGICR